MWFVSDLHEWVKLLSFGNLITEGQHCGGNWEGIILIFQFLLPLLCQFIKKSRCSQNKLISVGMITYSVFYTLKPNYFVQLLHWWSVDCNLQFLQACYAADNVLYNPADVIKASSKDVKKYLTPLYRPPALPKQKWPHIGSSLLNPDLRAPTSLPA